MSLDANEVTHNANWVLERYFVSTSSYPVRTSVGVLHSFPLPPIEYWNKWK